MNKLANILLILSLAAQTEAAQGYDVAILNGRVMNPGTQFDGIRNLGVKDGKITTITKDKIAGADTISNNQIPSSK